MKRFIYMLTLLTLATGCVKQRFTPDQDVPLNLAIKLRTVEQMVIDPTKSNTDENTITDVNVWVFDGSGNLLNNYYIANIGNAPFEIRTSSGQRNLVFVANYGSQIAGVSTMASIDGLVYTNLTPTVLTNTPMVKKTGVITIPTPLTAGGVVSLDPIELMRLTSKLTFTFDHSALNPGVQITPTRIVLHQVPKTTNFFANNSPTVASNILSRGDSLEVLGGIVSADHTTAQPLYMLENQQGITSNTDPKTKNPPAGTANYCTYFEITANYRSPEKVGKIVYRLYMGGNIYSDFNVIRNNWYQASIQFRGKGGVSENTWRVNVAGLSDILMPTSYCMPYMSGRANYYLIPPVWSTNIPAISGDNPVLYWSDSARMVLTKVDNLTSTYNDIGNFSSPSPVSTYPVKVVGAGTNDIFLDVSTLLFPKNARFGSKNYYVTQYVNIMNLTNQSSLTALSSTDWLYVSEGSSTQAFSSSGNVGQVGYGGMNNHSSGELALTAATNGYLAVRVTENTLNVARQGQILFFDAAGNECARVYVNQNPSTYPVSPVHLSYVAGGIIKAGAFNSAALVPSVLPLLASLLNIYSVISPFFIASKETTTQQFADFMNDLGISSTSALVNTANTILGKVGTMLNDYLGLNLSSITTPVNTSLAMIEYTGGKWISSKKQIYKSYNVATTGSVWVGNYPINEVGFYTACDYNYWASKYSGTIPSRLTGRLLVTELEWETAARGVVNQFGVLAIFLLSPDPQKNGAYPYAMPQPSYNSGLTGAETGEVSVLKSFAWYKNNASDTWPKSSGGIFNHNIHPSGNLFPSNRGLYDMNGNVGEWVFDNYNGLIGMSFLPEILNDNVVQLGVNTARVVRGGGVDKNASANSNVARSSAEPNTLSKYVGFRTIIRTVSPIIP